MRDSRESTLHWPRLIVAGAALLTLTLAGPAVLQAEEEPSLRDALKNGKASVNLDFACRNCHRNQTVEWAAEYADNFHGTEEADEEVALSKPAR